MAPTAPTASPAAPAAWRRALRLPVVVLAVVVVLVDEAFRAVVLPGVHALARLRPVQRLEAAIARLPRYATLALFVIPLAIIEPLKIYALFLFGEGRWVEGCLIFVVAKVVGLGLAERLFAISRDKLLSIGWFAWCHGKLVGAKDLVHAWLLSTTFWPAAVRFVRRVREGLRRARTWLRQSPRQAGAGAGTLVARFAAARRLARRASRL